MLALAAFLAMPVPAPQDALASYYLVEIGPGPKRIFHTTDEANPRAPFKPGRGYVVAGDLLVASGSRGGFTRVTFVGSKGRPTEGWIETRALVQVVLPPAKPAAWRGEWTGWDAEIEVGPAAAGKLHVEGSATWGGHDPVRVANGGVHVGEFAVDAKPDADRLAFSIGDTAEGGSTARPVTEAPDDEFRCRVRLRLLGPYLLVEDNNMCGGANVTFTGTYRRR
jgi:hypothetical protein